MEPADLFNYFDKAGTRFVNYFGIGQVLDMASSCTYYLDCPGTAALPSIKNDFVNGVEVKTIPHPNVNIVLSMTFIDLAHPEGAADMIRLYDKVADRLIFDARATGEATRPGGLGKSFDWRLLDALAVNVPFMLSGGLHAGNVAEALRITAAPGVDVSSGVERAPGEKDADKIRAFVVAARDAAGALAARGKMMSGA